MRSGPTNLGDLRFTMFLPPRSLPLVIAVASLAALAGIAAVFVARLHEIAFRPDDLASVRLEVRRIIANTPSATAAPKMPVRAGIPAEVTENVETFVAQIGSRMSELGAPLWETQATALKQALAAGSQPRAVAGTLPDEVIGGTAPVLSPRQVQILALVQAESRWAKAMGAEESHHRRLDASLR